MNNQEIKNFTFFKKIEKLAFVQKIILYGSRARNDAQERSDIDLAIVCPQATNDTWLAIIDIIEEADTLLQIDCVRYDFLNDSNPLKKSIDVEGLILLERIVHYGK